MSKLNRRPARLLVTLFSMLATVLTALFITPVLSPHSAQAQNGISGAAPSSSPAIPAPEFDLPQIVSGSMKSADLKGNVVVLDLWATWCAPCIEEIPNYNGLAEKYKDKNVRVIGIVFVSGSFEEVQAAVPEFKIRYPVLFGTEEILAEFGVTGFPATVVLTRNWTVHQKFFGLTPNKKELIEQAIDTLLSNPLQTVRTFENGSAKPVGQLTNQE